MTFQKFEKLFLSKYPDGEAYHHGEFAGNEKNRKVSIVFNHGGKVYDYYGAYEDVLCKVGVPTISTERMENMEYTLSRLQETHGKPDEFFGFVADNSKDIERLANEIERIKATHVIV